MCQSDCTARSTHTNHKCNKHLFIIDGVEPRAHYRSSNAVMKANAYVIAAVKVTITSLLINIHEMFSVLIFSTQQDATETW